MNMKHTDLIHRQFGSTANAYVTSSVHASGADLDWIAERAHQCRPARALDLGTGGGHVAYALAAHADRVMASDLSPDMLEEVAAEAGRRGIDNIDRTAAPAEKLPFTDEAFDFLTCRFSTHHWQNAQAGLTEARRVLTNGAPALFVDICAPQTSAAADTHLQAVELLRDPSHIRDYTPYEWLNMLGRAGFSVRSFTTARLRMDFTTWTARMQTPDTHIAAIRALQSCASSDVTSLFAIEEDGSFTIDMVLIEAV
ncbi:class I SAM-dependent methyltransferase [Altericroceibacterium spongiae]|uniref:Class I SAM-dependent methyltransferase n=1 Tax=Altericroceibacterium spongiae TaxID=2320269 RepID=A0A420EEU8_9SPHN|nr:class I SAM-dependent methyltransferase [Altericroceibacterium spongiae]RKF19203.1 class I SAM-dependent methyltransferase [Altericroceibacterium spongiae]